MQNRARRIQNAILALAIARYQQQGLSWFDDPAIKKALLFEAFSRWQSLVIITIIIVAVVFWLVMLLQRLNSIVPMMLILLALTAEVMLLYFSIKDEKRQLTAVMQVLTQRVRAELDSIRDKRLKARLFKALECWALIDETIKAMRQSPLRDHLQTINQEATAWLQTIYALVKQADQVYLNMVLHGDLPKLFLPSAVDEQSLTSSDDWAKIDHSLKQITTGRQLETQGQTLATPQAYLQDVIRQLDSTISALGTVCSQILLIHSKRGFSPKMMPLQEAIVEQRYHLEDLVAVMKNVDP